MPDIPHLLDRRQAMLTEAILHQKKVLTAVLKPVGGKPPFTEQITTDEAFTFWSKNRYRPLGQAAVSRMTPLQVAELDAWRAREVNERQAPGPLLP